MNDEIEVTHEVNTEITREVNTIYAPNRDLLHKTQYVITIFKVRPHEYYQEVSTKTFPLYDDPANTIIQASGYGEGEIERLDQYSRVGVHHVAILTRIRWFSVQFYNTEGKWVLDCEPLMDYEFARSYASDIGSSDYKKWVGTKGFLATSFNTVKLTDVPLSAGKLEGPGMPGWAMRSMTTMPGWAG